MCAIKRFRVGAIVVREPNVLSLRGSLASAATDVLFRQHRRFAKKRDRSDDRLTRVPAVAIDDLEAAKRTKRTGATRVRTLMAAQQFGVTDAVPATRRCADP